MANIPTDIDTVFELWPAANMDIDEFKLFLQEVRERDLDHFEAIVTALNHTRSKNFAARQVSATATLYTYDHFIDADTSSGSVTLTLPSPVNGIEFIISKAEAANTLTVDGGSKNINGAATLAWTTQYQTYHFKYINDAGEWRAW